MVISWTKQWTKRLAEEPKLCDQFLRGLRATFEQAKRNNPSASPEITQKIQGFFNDEQKTWEVFYEIERLLVEIYDGPTLDLEIGRRLVDTQRVLFANEFQYYNKELETIRQSNSEPLKRAFLSRLLSDLQWCYSVNNVKRIHGGVVRNLTALTFIISILPFFWIVNFLSPDNAYYYLYVAVAAGCWGASFSMLISLKERLKNSGLDDLRILRSLGFVLSRLVIGIGAALILYFFLGASILEGSIFPQLDSFNSDKDFALLVIWSFIAGFSEKFVPGLLTKTEQKVQSS